MALLSVAEALRRILDGVEPVLIERMALINSTGLTLAEDLTAKSTQPPFNASAMDGYAMRAADLAALPVTLQQIGESQAGRAFQGRIASGQCVRILTGAPLPDGADAIVIRENTDVDADRVTIRQGTVDIGHIRLRGGDFLSGDVLLRSGRRLDARAIMLAAAMGHASLAVRRKPVVAIIATGDELVLPGATLGPHQIVCSNPFGLAALVTAFGGEPQFIGIARDTHEDIGEKVASAGGADVLVTTGGASVGDHDLVAPALEARGLKLDFWKIAMRPGKPMLFGRLGAQRVLGLPGNPVSALVCARLFLVPLLARLLGQIGSDAVPVTATLTVPLAANGPRDHYMRATLDHTSAPPRVTPIASQDSSLVSALAAAECLIVVPANGPAMAAGAPVQILRLDF